jgi:hypothetical protein
VEPVRIVEFTGLPALAAALLDVDDDTLVLAVPPGALVASTAEAAAAYELLDGSVVLAADEHPRVPTDIAAAHPDVSTPYRFVAGDALAGTARPLRDLATGASGDDDARYLTDRYLAGDDLELDVGAELFGDARTAAPVIVGVDDLNTRGLLTYDGAIASIAPRARSVAPEIVAMPFWTSAFCASVVDAAEAADRWASDDADPVPGVEVSLATLLPRLFLRVEDHVGAIVAPALREVWPEFAWNGLTDAFVIKYEAGVAPSLPLHHDVAQISGSVRCNDGYTGGALEFPRQQWDNAGVPVGDLVAWPSLVTHPHRALAVDTGVKYGLTLWFALPT